jgi:hypothetical protein
MTDLAEIMAPLRRMFDAMENEAKRLTLMRERHGRWRVPCSRAEITVVWWMTGVKPASGKLTPNA